MANLYALIRYSLRYFYLPYLVLSLVLIRIMPIIFSVQYLDMYQTARILELYLVFNGMLILGPLFYPEEDQPIRNLILSKKQSFQYILTLRLLLAIIILLVLLFLNLIIFKINQCEFSFAKYMYGGFTSAWVLGGICVFTSGVSGSTIIGYLVGFVYYLINFGSGSKYLGKFYLFSMLQGGISDKIYLFGLGTLLISAGFVINVCKRRKLS